MAKIDSKESAATATKRRSAFGRPLVRAAAWILAVPVLCMLVILGGAAPVYLLLPDAPTVPVQQEAGAGDRTAAAPDTAELPVETASLSSDAPPKPTSPVSGAEADTRPAAEIASPPVEETEGAAGGGEEAEAEIAVVPTPRPAFAAVDPAAPENVAAGAPRHPEAKQVSLGASSPVHAKPRDFQATRRSTTIRPVALRSGPGGREIETLGRGAEVLVGRCDGWCEVRAGGTRGWIHPSFLTDAAGRNVRARPEAQRYDRQPAEPRGRYRAIEDRRGRDRDWRDDIPERSVANDRWLREEREPVEFYGYE